MTFSIILACCVGLGLFLRLFRHTGKAPTLGGKLYLLWKVGGHYFLYSMTILMIGFMVIQDLAEIITRKKVVTQVTLYGTLVSNSNKAVYVSGTSNCIFVAETTNGVIAITREGVIGKYISTNGMDQYTFKHTQYFVPKWIAPNGIPFSTRKEISEGHTFNKART